MSFIIDVVNQNGLYHVHVNGERVESFDRLFEAEALKKQLELFDEEELAEIINSQNVHD